MKRAIFQMIVLLTIIFATSCKDDQEVSAPLISGIEAEYTIEEGVALNLSPIITNDNQSAYVWLLDGKEVANTPIYTFNSAKIGVYTLVFKVSNKGGTTQKNISVTVTNGAPVVSGIQEEYLIEKGDKLELTPDVTGGGELIYQWILDGKNVANTPAYTFNSSETGNREIILKVTNPKGSVEKKISVVVLAETIRLETTTYSLLSLDVPSYSATEKTTQWEVIEASSELYRLSFTDTPNPMFVAGKEGQYILYKSEGEIKGKIIITVNKRKTQPSAYISKVFDYMPAPGQFVNKLPEYNEGDSHEDMVNKVGEWLIGEDAYMITLGGWGGYVTFGFDHTIINVPEKRDFRVNGNAFGAALGRPGAPFGGSCEPGIIMVAYDKNKNGKPDDEEWYEIKGSSNFSAEKEPWYTMAKENHNDVNVYRDYEVTYYKPTKEDPEISGEPDNPLAFTTIKNYIRWEDNKKNSGYKIKNVYHSQSYYPGWIKKDNITFKGIRLPENGINEGEYVPGINEGNIYFVLYGFRYGYVDNQTNVSPESGIDIDWAIDKAGNKAGLPGIDFVKVYNGVNQENGWLGECSTEVERGEDLHVLGKSISTIDE
ncbi:MAG TPA: hypothetical protein DDZ96_01015 [Porphyromonadaceae bacterium]|jgi:hypothetical protein|nr:hypothetical protein [Porphyromonadaceae bacterium]HBL32384.1 hypothetical protein [Porphyromonadaceae bacterium]HBX21358.1 hypothetical protein [Porphyromonadaceae bacterium]HCM19890.1 hypothetical protein [Porphyromonadaceae bacterium]